MEIAAVVLARSVAFVETIDLNPRGLLSLPHTVALINERFQFKTSPLNKPPLKDGEKENKDLEFKDGYFQGVGVGKLTISGDGVVVDVRSSTTDAKRIINDSLTWLGKEIGLYYSPEMITRWSYVSQLTFYSKVDILKPNAALSRLKERLTASVLAEHEEAYDFESTAVALDFDRTLHKRGTIQFTIQRRQDARFSENKYYSDAPVSTEEHIELLQAYEADMKELNK